MFNYTVSSKAARIAGREATAAGFAEKNTRLDAEQEVSRGADAWRHVYNLIECLGPSKILVQKFMSLTNTKLAAEAKLVRSHH